MLCQRGENFLRHTVGEEFIIGITAHALERQHRDRSIGRLHLCAARRLSRCRFDQRGGELARRVKPINRDATQCPLQRARHLATHALAQRGHVGRRLHEAFGDDCLDRGAGERWLAHQHFVQHAGQRVEIAATVHVFTHGLLRTRIRGRPDTHAKLRERARTRVVHRLTDPEIGEQRVPVLQQDVLGLYVAMHHVGPMRVLQRASDLHGKAHGVGHGDMLLTREAVAQRFTNDSPVTTGIT